MLIEQFLIGKFKNFIYLLTDPISKCSMVVDPQEDCEPWEKAMGSHHSKLVGVLLTHTHHDHIAGVPKVSEKYSVPIHVHEADFHRIENKYSSHTTNLIKKFSDQTKIKIGSVVIEVLHAPGHSSGEVCFLTKDTQPWSLLTGDTIFVGNVGRTDLETGSDEEMFETIQKIKKLPRDTIIYPGHDYGITPISTIATECSNNLCFKAASVQELKDLP